MIAATANEVLERVTVLSILSALGVENPRRGNRTQCPACRAGNQTLSINENKGGGVWHCFRCNQGGGKVALVRAAMNCEPKAALEWIAHLAGLTLAQCSREEQRARAIELQSAESEGRQLIEWRTELIRLLREYRECFQLVYWMGIRLGMSQCDEGWLWSRIREYDKKIQWHEEQPWDVMVSIYRDSLEPRTVSARYRRAA